jgi:hypothetical protein
MTMMFILQKSSCSLIERSTINKYMEYQELLYLLDPKGVLMLTQWCTSVRRVRNTGNFTHTRRVTKRVAFVVQHLSSYRANPLSVQIHAAPELSNAIAQILLFGSPEFMVPPDLGHLSGPCVSTFRLYARSDHYQ